MTLRKDLIPPTDPRDRAATRPSPHARPDEALKDLPEPGSAAPPVLPSTAEDEEPTDEGSARPLPDPQGEGRY